MFVVICLAFANVRGPEFYNAVISDPNLDTVVSLDSTESSIHERPYIPVHIKLNENGGRTITEVDEEKVLNELPF